MRFTPDILRKHTDVLVEKETKRDRTIIAAYLRGSLLYGSPLLGGAGDIDLVFIHNSPTARINHVQKLTPEIHFDIEHHDHELYQKPRILRDDPWLGPALHDALPLHDPRHILDYTQAGVRSNFSFPENIQARTSPLIIAARQFWLDRQIELSQDIIVELPLFLKALQKAVNAIALLTGNPLPGRRLGSLFPERAQAAGAPGLSLAFSHLIGSVSVSVDQLSSWVQPWEQALNTLYASSSPVPVLAEKKTYYQAAFQADLDQSKTAAVLWPLITTWTDAVAALPGETALQTPWIKALTTLGFAGKDYQTKLVAFDSFLEMCESLVLGDSSGEGGDS